MKAFKQLVLLIIKYDCAGGATLLLINSLIGIMPGFSVTILSLLLRALNQKDATKVIIYVAFFLSIQFLVRVLSEMESKVKTVMQLRLRKGYAESLLQKVERIKIELLEDREILDLKERVFDKGAEKLFSGFGCALDIMSTLISIIVISAIVCTKSLPTSLMIVGLDVLVILMAYNNGRKNYVENKQATIHRRYYGYLEKVQLSKDAALERKVFDTFDFFYNKWSSENDKARKLEMGSFLKYFLSIRMSSFIEIFIVLGILILLGKNLNGGDGILFISLAGYVLSIFQIHTESLPFSLSQLAKTMEYVKDERAFMALEEVSGKQTDMMALNAEEIKMEWRNVTFRYPGAKEDVIRGIDLSLDLNRHYAFVGKNGSGKSTMMKLIMGVYEHYEGSITLGGKELRECTPKELRGAFAAVFQNYSKYALSIKDNIVIGDLNYEGDKDGRVESILRKIGLAEAVTQRKDGADALLWKSDIGYTDFSEGQWQRLVVGRSLYSEARMKILDEPTAAIDPSQERMFFEEYAKMREKSGTILISHRLGSVKNVDEIFVLDDGRIIEKGNHEELMAKKGLYYEMYKEQENWYVT